MKIFTAPKGEGKTTLAVEVCIKIDAYLVVKNLNEASRVFDIYSRRLGMSSFRMPVTYDDVLRGRLSGSYVKNVVIDNIDDFVYHACNSKGLNAFMGTIDQDFETSRQLNKSISMRGALKNKAVSHADIMSEINNNKRERT